MKTINNKGEESVTEKDLFGAVPRQVSFDPFQGIDVNDLCAAMPTGSAGLSLDGNKDAVQSAAQKYNAEPSRSIDLQGGLGTDADLAANEIKSKRLSIIDKIDGHLERKATNGNNGKRKKSEEVPSEPKKSPVESGSHW